MHSLLLVIFKFFSASRNNTTFEYNIPKLKEYAGIEGFIGIIYLAGCSYDDIDTVYAFYEEQVLLGKFAFEISDLLNEKVKLRLVSDGISRSIQGKETELKKIRTFIIHAIFDGELFVYLAKVNFGLYPCVISHPTKTKTFQIKTILH